MLSALECHGYIMYTGDIMYNQMHKRPIVIVSAGVREQQKYYLQDNQVDMHLFAGEKLHDYHLVLQHPN